ncbi:MAG: thiamine-phosphate kinase [Flavobacteriales bacterium]|jgi:thiamine-monophosphate kinase|nr:thiamine-phosphate kinase [Flavobacteriales bacterium]
MFENKDTNLTTIGSLGEFKLIDHLTKNFQNQNKSTLKGIGDDAAVINCGTEKMVVSTDLLVEGVHFDLSYAPLKHLGYKAVAVNVSDICAMNAKPTQITVSIAVSSRFSVEALEALYEGIRLACKHFQVDLVGGDTSSSLSGMMISVTAIGKVSDTQITYRSGAQENDLIVVSGDLGGAYMGLQLLEREKEVFKVNPNMQPQLNEEDSYLLERQLKPEARLDIIDLLAKMEIKPHAMIDVSDGLSSDLLHICTQSKVGCRIYENKIPMDPTLIHKSEEFQIHPLTPALNGGEDYELLFTISMDDFEKIKGNPHLSVIGHITDEASGHHIITNSEEILPLVAQGWNHGESDSE